MTRSIFIFRYKYLPILHTHTHTHTHIYTQLPFIFSLNVFLSNWNEIYTDYKQINKTWKTITNSKPHDVVSLASPGFGILTNLLVIIAVEEKSVWMMNLAIIMFIGKQIYDFIEEKSMQKKRIISYIMDEELSEATTITNLYRYNY